jgi:hypothetical protein
MGTTKKGKAKPKCCGKFRKKNKHCSRCPVTFREQCKLDTERLDMGKKKEDKKKAKKKAEKALSKKKACKKKDKKCKCKTSKKKTKKKDQKKGKKKK